MMERNCRLERILHRLILAAFFLTLSTPLLARPRSAAPGPQVSPSAVPTKKSPWQDDSMFTVSPKDLLLRAEGEHKADAFAHFVEGMRSEEHTSELQSLTNLVCRLL